MNWYVTSKQKQFSTNVDKVILIYRLFQSFLFYFAWRQVQ